MGVFVNAKSKSKSLRGRERSRTTANLNFYTLLYLQKDTICLIRSLPHTERRNQCVLVCVTHVLQKKEDRYFTFTLGILSREQKIEITCSLFESKEDSFLKFIEAQPTLLYPIKANWEKK